MNHFEGIDYEAMFGNDSGENEKSEALKEYFVEVPAFDKFFDHTSELGFVRARKGMGKSALLKILSLRRKEEHPDDIVIFTTGNELMGLGDFTNKGQAYLENHWKQVICKRICVEIGLKINFATSDLQMSMVEAAELEGYKDLNILSALTERTGGMINNALAAIGGQAILDASKKRGIANPLEALKNFQNKGDRTVWVLVDDIDAKYVDDDDHQQRIGAFFSAMRSLAFGVSGLRLRASVRTDVWRNLRKMEDQDKLRQYAIDINWSDDALRNIFTQKIFAYLKRENFQPILESRDTQNHIKIFDQVFRGKFSWKKREVHPFIPLKFLAGGRPRWMGQLAKLAGSKAGTNRISESNIYASMQDFGQEKLSDIQKEHSHQFGQLDKLIQSFQGGKRAYNRFRLLTHIDENFVKKIVNVALINGYPYKDTEQLAAFLFEIDFLMAQRPDKTDDDTYNSAPDLFMSEENAQNKIQWTVHSSYRNFLRIQ